MLSQLSNPWWVFVLLGIVAGIISGTLGLGSGIILIPALVLFYAFEQKCAQGMALAIMVPMALVGAFRYWKNPQIEMNMVVIGLIIAGAVAGALIGAELAIRLPSHILRKVFAIFLVIVAIRMFIGPSKSKKTVIDNTAQNQGTVNLVESGEINNEPGK